MEKERIIEKKVVGEKEPVAGKTEDLKELRKLEDSKFYLHNKMVFLTYGKKGRDTWLNKEEYRVWLRGKLSEKKISVNVREEVEEIHIAHESADETNPYKHTHVLVVLKEALQTKDCRWFDFKGLHPNIKTVRYRKHLANCYGYLAKEDPENKLLEEWKKDLVGCVFDSVKECDNDSDAMKSYVKKGYVSTAYGGRPSDDEDPLARAEEFAQFAGRVRLYNSTNDPISSYTLAEEFCERSGIELISMGAVGHDFDDPYSEAAVSGYLQGEG